MKKTGVLICDDSALMRRTLTKVIESSPDLYVAGTARDGEDAVNKARELKPDVVTMDINMPRLDGITALQIIVDEKIAPVLMISSLTRDNAEITFEALALGAFDYVFKPGGTISLNMRSVNDEIIKKLKEAARSGIKEKLKRSRFKSSFRMAAHRHKPIEVTKQGTGTYRAIAIGISTGGPKTIYDILPNLPSDFNAAIFMVQHMPPTFTESFARSLGKSCRMKCMEVKAATLVEPGTIYIAKGGHHLTLYKKPTGEILIRTPQKPDHTFIPSVDVMMKSVLAIYGRDTIGVLMTGIGDDGADSMVEITKAGGYTIAESEESAIVFGMPKEAIERGGAKIVLPSWKIAEELYRIVG